MAPGIVINNLLWVEALKEYEAYAGKGQRIRARQVIDRVIGPEATVADVAHYGYLRLQHVKGCGRATLETINHVLGYYGLRLDNAPLPVYERRRRLLRECLTALQAVEGLITPLSNADLIRRVDIESLPYDNTDRPPSTH